MVVVDGRLPTARASHAAHRKRVRVVVAVPAAQVGHRGADGRHVVGVQGQVQVQAQAGVRVVCGRREPAAVDDGAHPRQLRRPAGAIGERAAQRRRAWKPVACIGSRSSPKASSTEAWAWAAVMAAASCCAAAGSDGAAPNARRMGTAPSAISTRTPLREPVSQWGPCARPPHLRVPASGGSVVPPDWLPALAFRRPESV